MEPEKKRAKTEDLKSEEKGSFETHFEEFKKFVNEFEPKEESDDDDEVENPVDSILKQAKNFKRNVRFDDNMDCVVGDETKTEREKFHGIYIKRIFEESHSLYLKHDWDINVHYVFGFKAIPGFEMETAFGYFRNPEGHGEIEATIVNCKLDAQCCDEVKEDMTCESQLLNCYGCAGGYHSFQDGPPYSKYPTDKAQRQPTFENVENFKIVFKLLGLANVKEFIGFLKSINRKCEDTCWRDCVYHRILAKELGESTSGIEKDYYDGKVDLNDYHVRLYRSLY
eukprot:TRINITY_DN71_c1_g1_i1.p1 TRINITY_DN71_c1_g1~~TRINITY_DN71_c1_g1_i1.p1  ORF type:complete len:292 (+),score=75.18 TRINITY_DN71_c1_g1_i1:33-878(+)